MDPDDGSDLHMGALLGFLRGHAMPITGPSTPTIPPPSPRQFDRPIGQRYAHVYDVLRRPSRPGYWVRAGAPSLNARLQARRPHLLIRVIVAVGIGVMASLIVMAAVLAYSDHQLDAFLTNEVRYVKLAEDVRALDIQAGGPVWRLPTTAVLGDVRGELDALGIRQVQADETVDALLFRPGGAGVELAYVHLGGGEDGHIGVGEKELLRAAFTQQASSWTALGDGWYRLTGRW